MPYEPQVLLLSLPVPAVSYQVFLHGHEQHVLCDDIVRNESISSSSIDSLIAVPNFIPNKPTPNLSG